MSKNSRASKYTSVNVDDAFRFGGPAGKKAAILCLPCYVDIIYTLFVVVLPAVYNGVWSLTELYRLEDLNGNTFVCTVYALPHFTYYVLYIV